MKRLVLALGALFAACSSPPPPVAAGEFAGPSALAATSAGDRDLLFIANEGRENLRALQLCREPQDGGTTNCDVEDQQFLPAPIRVFPATVETGTRPRRLAAVRLLRPDAAHTPTGAVLAAGDDTSLRVVDSLNLVEAAKNLAPAKPVLKTPLDALIVDVAAENATDGSGLEIGTGQTGTAYAALAATPGGKPSLIVLSVSVDANGAVTAPTVVGKCTLDGVSPSNLATVPGGGDRIYVADGAGDGVVAVAKAGIAPLSAAPPPCPMDRFSTGGRQVRSVSVSPAFTDTTGVHKPGELLIVTLDPLARAFDAGGVLILNAATKSVVPVPPLSVFDTSGAQPMEPLAPPPGPGVQPQTSGGGIAREVAFLRQLPAGGLCTAGPCTPIAVAYGDNVRSFPLVAAVTSTSGATYLVDVIGRRLVSAIDPSTIPTFTAPALSYASESANPPTLTMSTNDAAHPNIGWLTSGVTRSAQWRVVWHAALPGLETRGGFLTQTGTGTFTLKLPGTNLNLYASDPALQLAPGDTVSFSSFVAPAGAPQGCVDLASSESKRPTSFELVIASRPAIDTLELQPFVPNGVVSSFGISACPSGVGVVGAIRAAGARPWTVFDAETALGRARNGEQFVAMEPRFDYPPDAPALGSVVQATDVAVAFTVTGDDPAVPGTEFTFSTMSGEQPQSIQDPTIALTVAVSPGLATAVLGYSSPRHPLLTFTALTGGNTVVQADPTVLDTVLNGVVAYK